MDNKLIQKFDKTQTEIAKVEKQIMQQTVDLQNKLSTLKEQDSEVRQAIKEAMEKHDVKKFENDNMTITYIAPTKRKGIDSSKLEQMHPKIYKQVLKFSDVKSSVRIILK